jgi:hypothetical protein
MKTGRIVINVSTYKKGFEFYQHILEIQGSDGL